MPDNSPENRPMYTAIHHDRFNDLIFIWYADGTKNGFRVNTVHTLLSKDKMMQNLLEW